MWCVKYISSEILAKIQNVFQLVRAWIWLISFSCLLLILHCRMLWFPSVVAHNKVLRVLFPVTKLRTTYQRYILVIIFSLFWLYGVYDWNIKRHLVAIDLAGIYESFLSASTKRPHSQHLIQLVKISFPRQNLHILPVLDLTDNHHRARLHLVIWFIFTTQRIVFVLLALLIVIFKLVIGGDLSSPGAELLDATCIS